jgi:hypothetical protein
MADDMAAVHRMDMETLERIMNRVGPHGVACLLREICGEKAEHVRSAWQDEALAGAWERNGAVFDRASGKLTA